MAEQQEMGPVNNSPERFVCHQLIKRAMDEVPTHMQEYVRRVGAGEHDCPSPWRLAALEGK